MEAVKTVKTGIVRCIDDLGRIVLPREIRRTAHIVDGDPLEIWVDPDGDIRMRKYTQETIDLAHEVARLQYYVDVSESNNSDKSRWIRKLEEVRKEMALAQNKKQ